MSMFETFGKTGEAERRKETTLRKLDRMNRALRHEEPDRVPISDFFWGSFKDRWRRDLGLPDDADPYYHYDLDWIVTVPNMDPWIRPFETLREDAEEVVVKTGFGAVLRKHFEFPMPETTTWEVDTFEKLEQAVFDGPAGFSRRATTRLRAWGMVFSATRRRGLKRSNRCGRISRSMAA